ncbi:esterase/lipase family protein [Corynebacterium sp. NPDC060344]|uniref:esterase/lipase family protein n=1 Tax=Corynebacterium sp. NPDC060344 TaxID=3347101 RepID=UPI003657EC0A
MIRRRRGWAAVAAFAMAAALGMGTGTAAAAPAGSAGSAGSSMTEEAFPELEWANDPECVPAAEHPQPVLLIHGTWSVAGQMKALAQPLVDAGHCVYALGYGWHRESLAGSVPGNAGVGDVVASARAVDEAIRYVAGETAAGKAAGAVDVIGHSQAAALMHVAMGEHGAAQFVDDAIYLAGTHRGTSMGGLDALNLHSSPEAVAIGDALLGPAALQQLNGSDVVAHLRSLPDTVPGVDYTVLVSRDDTTASAAPGAFLEAGPGATVTNVLVQDACPQAPSPLTHDHMRDHPIVHGLVAEALAGRPVVCA